MAADDSVQLTDLQVIQRYSLAVRAAAAPRADLVAALRADLAWLTSKPAPAKKAAAKPAARRAPTKSGARGA
jgi:hypothetical protein